jgi:hypothetical protein
MQFNAANADLPQVAVVFHEERRLGAIRVKIEEAQATISRRDDRGSQQIIRGS